VDGLWRILKLFVKQSHLLQPIGQVLLGYALGSIGTPDIKSCEKFVLIHGIDYERAHRL
jgi:hypothetical protein